MSALRDVVLDLEKPESQEFDTHSRHTLVEVFDDALIKKAAVVGEIRTAIHNRVRPVGDGVVSKRRQAVTESPDSADNIIVLRGRGM